MKRVISIIVMIDDNERIQGKNTITKMQLRDMAMLIMEIENQLDKLKKQYHLNGGGVQLDKIE
jgi:hypothetical protein